ncbi:MAG: DoxX family protein [Anaerolineae bacterium]
MDIVLNILQGLVGLAFLVAGGMKVAMSKAKLAENGDSMAWTEDFAENQIKMIGGAEALGGLALLISLFVSSQIALLLGGLAGICLAILMGGAVYTHIKRNETGMAALAPSAVLGVLALIIGISLF